MHGSKKVSVAICLRLNLRLTGLISVSVGLLNYQRSNYRISLFRRLGVNSLEVAF